MIVCTARVKYRERCAPLSMSSGTCHWLTAKKVPLRAADPTELDWLLEGVAEDTLKDHPGAEAVHVEANYSVNDCAGCGRDGCGEHRYHVGYYRETLAGGRASGTIARCADGSVWPARVAAPRQTEVTNRCHAA